MPTVHYIGDSTVARNNYRTYPQTGMSQGLYLYLSEKVNIRSYAKNGRSTKSFIDEGRLPAVEEGLQEGDFLFIQFGHNDSKPDAERHTDPDTTFQDNLRLFVSTARKKGALPVLITPIGRRLFDEQGNFKPGSHGAYPDAIRKVAAETGTPLVDLTVVTEKFLAETGDEPTKPLFMWPIDNTHLKPEGAMKMAGFLAEGLAQLGEPYAKLLIGEDEGPGI